MNLKRGFPISEIRFEFHKRIIAQSSDETGGTRLVSLKWETGGRKILAELLPVEPADMNLKAAGEAVCRMIGHKSSAPYLAGAAAALLAVLAPAGETQQQTLQRVPRQDAAAVVKLVPVRVLDSAGRPVRGLKKQDFILHDNDEPKLITEFEVYESDRTILAAGEEAVAETKSRPEAQAKYFFVLDMQGSDRLGHKDARKAVLEFAETRLEPGDEAAVLTFGGMSGLVIKQYLTSDLGKIRQAIKRSLEIGARTGSEAGGGRAGVSGAELEEGERRAIAERPGAAGRSGGASEAAGKTSTESGAGASGGESSEMPFGLGRIQVEVPGLERAARNRADFDLSMAELAKAMRYVPGSKNLVYFSMRTPGKDVGRLFAESNTTVYAVNTNSVPSKGGGPGASQRRELKNRQGDALKAFAEASGGHYFADVADAKTIAEEVASLSGNYYVLGYYISPSWDGRLHRIKVDVKLPGVQVLVQEGYSDPKPYVERSDLEKKLQIFNLALSDSPVLTDALDLPACAFVGSMMSEANTAILLELEVEERTGVAPGKTEIYTFIFDPEHKVVVGIRGEMDTSAHEHQTLFPYLLASLKPGEYECRVVARNMETGQAAASRFCFAVPAPDPAKMTLSSPLLLIPGREADFVHMLRSTKKGKEPPSVIRFFPYLPRECAPLVGPLSPAIRRIWASLPLRFGTEMPAELTTEVKLMAEASGEEIPIQWIILDTGELRKRMNFVLFEIRLPDLAAGAYRLEFTALDVASGSWAAVKAPLEIR
jgi:VWFA-related protein